MAARAKTPTYIAELPLAATQEDERVLDHCRYLGLQADHCMVKEANRRLGRYYKDRAVHELLKRVRQNGYKLSPADKKVLAGKRMEYGLSEYDFHAYLKVFGRRVSGWLDANTVQKIATRVWQAASAVLFGRGGRVRYRRYDQFLSLEGKTNTMGIRYKDGCLIWGKRLKVPVVVRGSDRWLQRALQDRVKYCRVVARWHKTRWKYHLQLVLEGTPPTKPHRKAVEGEVGLDMGPSAIAAVSEGGILFQELGGEVASIEAETARLLRKLDRQRRANNPGNYDAAGRVKRLKRGQRRVWVLSNGYIKTRNQIRTLRAKRRALLKEAHIKLARQLLEQMGNTFVVEKLSWSGLAKRARETRVNEKTGRPARKKRFGKSVQNHAPSAFLSILTRMAGAAGGGVIQVDPGPIKASQYDHTDGAYTKVPLSQRRKRLSNGDEVLRDLYSAFLLLNHDNSYTGIDQARCEASYAAFKARHDELVEELRRQKAGGRQFPSCMGL